jgi:hypothetical protein
MTELLQSTSANPVRSRWWWMLAAIPPIVGVLAVHFAPEPHGHWTEHLSSVGLKATQLMVLVLLVALLGWRTLRLMLLISFAVVACGIVLQVFGDYQVAQSIWGTTVDPGFGVGYESGHQLSGLGDLLVVGGGIAYAVIAGATRRVPAWTAVVAAALAIIPPPFLWPAAGVLTLLLFDQRRTQSAPRR